MYVEMMINCDDALIPWLPVPVDAVRAETRANTNPERKATHKKRLRFVCLLSTLPLPSPYMCARCPSPSLRLRASCGLWAVGWGLGAGGALALRAQAALALALRGGPLARSLLCLLLPLVNSQRLCSASCFGFGRGRDFPIDHILPSVRFRLQINAHFSRQSIRCLAHGLAPTSSRSP
jgi:hypothetical protein